MNPQQVIEFARALFNIPDLVILAVVLLNIILGLKRGVLASVAGLVGRCIAMAGSYFIARQLAPAAAKWMTEPIVRSVFEHKLEQSGLPDSLAGGVQTALQSTIQSMSESIAYLVLIFVFSAVLSILISLAVKALRLLSRVTPLGVLDSLAGGAVGLATGLLLIVLVLLGAHWFYPVTFDEAGYLSPERIQNTVLLAKIITFIPFLNA